MESTGTVLSTVITGDMCMGVLSELTALLPVIIPVAIAYIGIRKGLSFVISTLRSA